MTLRDRKPSEDEARVDAINKVSNNMGQMLLTLTNGNWDLALSIVTTLVASTVAQAAVAHGESAEELFGELFVPTNSLVLALEEQFKFEAETET